MTVKELKKILENADENLEVYYNASYYPINGYYVNEDCNDKKSLVITNLNVMPRA